MTKSGLQYAQLVFVQYCMTYGSNNGLKILTDNFKVSKFSEVKAEDYGRLIDLCKAEK